MARELSHATGVAERKREIEGGREEGRKERKKKGETERKGGSKGRVSHWLK